MDIEKLYTVDLHEAGAEVQINGPDGKPTDIFIKMVGIDSKTWRNIIKRKERALLKMSYDEIAEVEDGYLILAEATLGWRGIESNGKPVEFSKKKAEQLYKNAPYIRDQVDVFIANRSNFMKG